MVKIQAVVDGMAMAIDRDTVSAMTIAMTDVTHLGNAMLLETNLSYAL